MSPLQQALFLEALAETGLPLKAMEAIGMPAGQIIAFIQSSPSFEQLAKQAALSYKESVITEVHRRGVLGWDEPMYFQGKRVTDFDPTTGLAYQVSTRRYDSALLQMEARRVEAGYRTGEQTAALQTNDPLKSVQQLDENYQDDNLMRIEFVDGGPIPEEDLRLLEDEAKKTSKMARTDGPHPALGDDTEDSSVLDTEMIPTRLNSTSISDNSKKISKTSSVSAPIVI